MWLQTSSKSSKYTIIREGQMASCRDPRPSSHMCWLVAGWAEAEIDTIHHECKWAAWFDISNKPVSVYQWIQPINHVSNQCVVSLSKVLTFLPHTSQADWLISYRGTPTSWSTSAVIKWEWSLMKLAGMLPSVPSTSKAMRLWGKWLCINRFHPWHRCSCILKVCRIFWWMR